MIFSQDSRGRWNGIVSTLLLLAGLGLVSITRLHASTNAPPADLTHMSLEELMNIQVTSASKKPEKLSEAPTSIYVINQEDIRRSGATSIPEALRLAPGLEVAQVDAHNWAITSHGFNDVFANKLLVMIDGRSVYTPLFSGVFWDVQDTMLEDVDRIEVMRGSGAVLWGENAVNGVINIITKKAKDTQGFLLTAGGGTEERAFGGFRYGGQAGPNTWFRIYGKAYERDDSALASGKRASDGYQMARGGFRIDYEPAQESTFTLQGDVYGGRVEQTFITATPIGTTSTINDKYPVAGGNLLARWTREFSPDSDLQVQTYYDRSARNTSIFGEVRNTFDVDLQYRLGLGERQTLVLGTGYRASHDDIKNTFTESFTPTSFTTHLFNVLVRDEISLVPERLKLFVGARIEHNSFTGFEVQPDARLLWSPRENFMAFLSAARAVRSPSRAENDVRINLPGPVPGTITSIFGSDDFDSETVTAYQVGFRTKPFERLFFGISAFYNEYDDLRSLEPGTPGGLPVVIPFTIANKLYGETYGIETGPRFKITESWNLSATYSFQQIQLHRRGSSLDTVSESKEGNSPQQQVSLRSRLNVTQNIDFDCGIRYVDSLPALNIPSYIAFDARLAWRPKPNLEISIVGQNLLDDRHPEFSPSLVPTQPTQVQRSIYGKVVWRF